MLYFVVRMSSKLRKLDGKNYLLCKYYCMLQMSCGGVSELVIERRAGGGNAVGTGTTGSCRLRGSSTSNTTPPNSKGGGGGATAQASQPGPIRPTKPCCFCWCCCCSCSWYVITATYYFPKLPKFPCS